MRHTLQVPRHPRSISTLLRKRPGTHTKHISRTPYSRACRPYPGKRLRAVPATTRRPKTISRALHALRPALSTHATSLSTEEPKSPTPGCATRLTHLGVTACLIHLWRLSFRYPTEARCDADQVRTINTADTSASVMLTTSKSSSGTKPNGPKHRS